MYDDLPSWKTVLLSLSTNSGLKYLPKGWRIEKYDHKDSYSFSIFVNNVKVASFFSHIYNSYSDLSFMTNDYEVKSKIKEELKISYHSYIKYMEGIVLKEKGCREKMIRDAVFPPTLRDCL